ncbi:hypothetical protein D3C84_979720 [compost metagenome]
MNQQRKGVGRIFHQDGLGRHQRSRLDIRLFRRCNGATAPATALDGVGSAVVTDCFQPFITDSDTLPDPQRPQR